VNRTPDASTKGLLLVHGVGAQAPGDTSRKLLQGLSKVPEAKVRDPDAEVPSVEINGVEVRLYEVYWADLLQGDVTKNTFSGKEFQAFAWFPLLNRRSKAYRPGAYSAFTVLGWTLVLPVLSLILALPYFGARLLASIFDRDYREQVRGSGGAGIRSVWRDARTRADRAAHGRTILEDTMDEFVGDVFNYVNSAGDARFPTAREKDVPDTVQHVYHSISDRFRAQFLRAADECGEVQVLAHSLGTVVSYHGLFGLRSDNTPAPILSRLDHARGKLTRLYTIGSPLEKIGFFWPKLVDPRVPAGSIDLQWENFVSWFDPVAGTLKRFNQWGEVRNKHLLGGGFVTGHVVYEKHPKFLRRLVSGLGAGPAGFVQGPWDRFRTWLLLLGETLVAPLALVLVTVAGAAIWAAVVLMLPWLASLLFRFDFMPEVDPAIFDQAAIAFAVMITGVFLINPWNDARRMHQAAWSTGDTDGEDSRGATD
jgi:hypothetical protein